MARPRFRAYPNNGTITISDGETYPLNVRGNFINVKSADQQFKILLDGQEELQAAQNRRFRLSENDTFNLVEIVNDSGNSLTFQLEIGFGGVESDDVSITGAVSVKNDATDDELQVVTKAGTTLKVDDDATQTAVSALQTAITDLLQNADDLRAPVTDLTGASYASANNSTNEFVSAASNVNGVMIRTLSLSGASNGNAQFTVGGDVVYRVAGGASSAHQKNIKVPAGLACEISSNAVGWTALVSYEVL